MDARKVFNGQVWISEETGQAPLVSPVYENVLVCYVALRALRPKVSEANNIREARQ
jgi:hypothetical protein